MGQVQRFFEASVLGMLLAGYLAVAGAGALSAPVLLLMLVAIGLRAARIIGIADLTLNSNWTGALALLCLGWFPVDWKYVSGNFVDATTHLVCFLAVIKVLSSETPRDYAYLRIIAGLELLAAAIYSVTPLFFACLAAFLLCGIASYVGGEVVRGIAPRQGLRVVMPPTLHLNRRLGRMTLGLFAGVLVITAMLFFVLPRTARATLGRFIPQRYHLPGFSNEVNLGEIGRIQQSSRTVMHARSYDGRPLDGLRWRGATLTQFDGKRWFNPPVIERSIPTDHGVLSIARTRIVRPGRQLAYQVQLSDVASDTLFFAGTPQTIRIGVPYLRFSRGGSIRIPPMGISGIGYGVYSTLEDEGSNARGALALDPDVRRAALALPPIDARIQDLAADWTTGRLGDFDRASAVEHELRTLYSYTLDLPDREPADPVANFLFVRRKGHCEYFASSMTVMLRVLGIPARIVTGFQSGELNPMTGWQVVRASDAHSWVEAWIPQRGWVTFDPTPIAPLGTRNALTQKFSLWLDAADQFWQEWVLSYDLERQIFLAARVGESPIRFKMSVPDPLAWWRQLTSGSWVPPLIAALVTGLLAVFLLFRKQILDLLAHRAGVKRLKEGSANVSDATRLYERALALLEKKGLQRPPWLTPVEFARVLPAGDTALLFEDLTLTYNEIRFGGKLDAAPRLVRLMERLESVTRSDTKAAE